MRKHLSTLMLVVVLLTGVSLLLYPTVSDYWNSFRQSRVVTSYTQSVAQMNEADYLQARQQAEQYNQWLVSKHNRLYMSDEEREWYNTLLNSAGNGVMGSVVIPSIDVDLPIYHGTDESVLQVAVGHIEGSSLPIGGADTHSVLSGHRGLPSAKLFTNLDRLSIGDQFMLHVLNETLTYEVDQILVVEPDEVSALEIESGQDLCTLVTCTPYGINTHRLLVQGRRVPTAAEPVPVRVAGNARSISQWLVFALLCLSLMLIWMALSILHIKKR